jgi:antibiotic biosynthesis monooxygenase (ABM) superfamily enzyme
MTIIDSQLDTTASQSDAVVENAITNNYVTVSVSRDVVAGRDADYEAWISGITTESSRFGGHLGVNVIRPSLGSRRYTIIYRFDNMDHAKAWQQSSQRQIWMAKIDGIVEGETKFKTATGLEVWFEFPHVANSKQPVKWRMSIVLIAVVYNLIIALNYVLAPWINDWDIHSRTAVIVTMQVLLMTYLVMPRVTHYVKGWLYV